MLGPEVLLDKIEVFGLNESFLAWFPSAFRLRLRDVLFRWERLVSVSTRSLSGCSTLFKLV